jgi:hypothetical protein
MDRLYEKPVLVGAGLVPALASSTIGTQISHALIPRSLVTP